MMNVETSLSSLTPRNFLRHNDRRLNYEPYTQKKLPHDDAVGSIPMKEVYKLNGPLTRNVRIMVVTLEVYAC